MKIQFAFALNKEGVFENKHFGEADNYAISTYNEHAIILTEIIPNPFKSMNGRQEHGLKEKGTAIISLLKEKNVKVLVSKQFGANIKMVNRHFIPVIISKENPSQVSEILAKNIKWLKDELNNRKSNYMLFKINTGALKLEVK
jgi:predicted Fe-Mo cluster-binding NifX family protein